MENSEEYEGLKIEAAAIAAMPEKKRYAFIIGKPRYVELPDFNDKEKTVRKVMIPVETSNGSKAEYIPNQKSLNFLANRLGTKFDAWVGIKLIWMAVKQNVKGNMKDVLYVSEIETKE